MSIHYRFILDADVFITAKNSYYAFAICTGFWDSLIHHHCLGNLCSIDRVEKELLAGRETEDLFQWAKNEVPKTFFLETTNEVMCAYSQVMTWVNDHSHYRRDAKNKFARGADGWLVAFAMVHKVIVITNEQADSRSKKRVKLPDVCGQFKVACKNPFEMLKELAVCYEYQSHSNVL